MEDSEIKLHERVTLTLKVSWRPVNFRDQRNIRQTDIVVKQMSVQGITLASAMDRRPNYYPPPQLLPTYTQAHHRDSNPSSSDSQSQLRRTYDAADPVFVARKLGNLDPSAFLEVPHPH